MDQQTEELITAEKLADGRLRESFWVINVDLRYDMDVSDLCKCDSCRVDVTCAVQDLLHAADVTSSASVNSSR